ncbi:MAG: transcription antitermination factor NusB [Dehalococcoidia bacterium]
MTKGRHQARIAALKALYEVDLAGHGAPAVLERVLRGTPLRPELSAFASELVQGVLAHRSLIDDLLRRTAPAWPLEQIAAIDRNILRLAIYEIMVDNRVPIRVVINEAVELAKAFGSDNSAKFVNGVLGSIALMAMRQS